MAWTGPMTLTGLSLRAREIYSGTDILCILGSAVLAGCLYNSATNYAGRFPTDALWLRAVVGALIVLSLISLGNSAGVLWSSFVTDGGMFSGETGPNIQLHVAYVAILFLIPILSGILSQTFFGLRAYRASGRRRWLGSLFVLLTTAHFALGMTALAKGGIWIKRSLQNLPNDAAQSVEDPWMGWALAVSALNDMVLTGVLSWSLARRQRGFNPETDALLTRIARATVTTGAISSVLATFIAIITLATYYDTDYFTSPPTVGRANVMGLPDGLLFVLPQLYPILVVGTLNLRFEPRSAGDDSPRRQSGKHDEGLLSTPPTLRPTDLYGMSESLSLPVAPSAKYERALQRARGASDLSEGSTLQRPRPTYVSQSSNNASRGDSFA